MDMDLTVYGSSRKTNPSFLNYFKSDVLQEKENSIHKELEDERRKYVALRNTHKKSSPNKVNSIMPVTNVIAHVRKSSENTRPFRRMDSESIMIEGNMLPYQSYRHTPCHDNMNNGTDQHCKGTCNSLNNSIPGQILQGEKCTPNKTCKCCGIVLMPDKKPMKDDSNCFKLQPLPYDSDLKCIIKANKYPLDINEIHTNDNDKTKSLKIITGSGFAAPTNELKGTDTKLDLHEPREFSVWHEQQYQIPKEYYTSTNPVLLGTGSYKQTILGSEEDVWSQHKEEYCTARNTNVCAKNFDETHDIANGLKKNERCASQSCQTDWRHEAKKELIEMGENIKIVNDVGKRNDEIRRERLASWSLAKWKHFTENNKSKRCRLEKVIFKRKLNLMRSYFDRWKQKSDTKIKEKNNRAEKMDSFLNALRLKQIELKQKKKEERDMIEKSKSTWNHELRSEFKNRLNTQKDIILSQKKKLAEAEEIMRDMKLEQILEQSKISRNTIVDSVKETIKHIDDPKLKVAANQIIKLKSTSLSDEKAKKLVESMEKRAKERQSKWQQIQERKKQKAEEKVKILQEQETKRLHEEEEKKRKKIQDLKEKRRTERENAIKKENERRRLESLAIIAENFHKKKLKQRSLRGFRENLRNSLIKMELAEKYYIYQLKRKYFLEWKFYTEEVIAEKEHLAEHFYDYILKRRVFDSFKEVYNTRILNMQVAMDYRDLKIQEKYLTKWKEFYRWRQRIMEYQMKEASHYYDRKLLLSCFLRWRKLPEIAFHEREKDKRLREWREKVKEVLPDFVPFELE